MTWFLGFEEAPVICLDLLCRKLISAYTMNNRHCFLFLFDVECNCQLWEIFISEVSFRPVSAYVVTPIRSRIKGPWVLEVIPQLDSAVIMDLLH